MKIILMHLQYLIAFDGEHQEIKLSVYEIFAVNFFVRHVEKLHPQKSLNIHPDQNCQLDKFFITHCSLSDESLYQVNITKQKIYKTSCLP